MTAGSDAVDCVMFVSPDGEAIVSIATDPGNYVSTIDHRVARK